MSELFDWAVKKGDHCLIQIHVQPGAKVSGPVGLHGNRLKWKLNAPPVDGKANSELICSIADFFQIKKSNISIRSGDSSRTKTLQISGVNLDQLISTLSEKLSPIGHN